jgi:restriction endonuclease Mrr
VADQAGIALGGSASIAELDAAVIDREQLTPEQRSVLLSGGRQAVVQNRLAWVVTARLPCQANLKSDSTCDITFETAPTVRLQPSGDIRAVAVLAV